MKKLLLLLIFSLLLLVGCNCATTPDVPEAEYYNVTFSVGDENYTVELEAGEIPVFHGTTERSSDENFTYRFDGWDKEFAPVCADVTYTAQYTAIPRDPDTVVITFVVGTDVYTEVTVVGEVPVFPGSTARPNENGVAFAFDGWDKELVPALTNDTYVAKYVSGTAKYPVDFVVDGEVIATIEVAHGECAELPEDITFDKPENYDGVFFLDLTRIIKEKTQIIGFSYSGDEELARLAYTAPMPDGGEYVGDNIAALHFLLKQTSVPMQEKTAERLNALATLEPTDYDEWETAMLFALLARYPTIPELLGDEEKTCFVSLCESLVTRAVAFDDEVYQVVATVFASAFFGEDSFEKILIEAGVQGYSYKGYPLSAPDALLEKALLSVFSGEVNSGYKIASVSYAYITDSSSSPYNGKTGMLRAFANEGRSEAQRAAKDMALCTLVLDCAKSLSICDFEAIRPLVFAKVWVGHADLAFKLSHGYTSFDGQKQSQTRENNVDVSYRYLNMLWDEKWGDVLYESLATQEPVTGSDFLVSAGELKNNNLTKTLTETAAAIAGDKNYYDKNDFLYEFSFLVDDDTASAEYRIRNGSKVEYILKINGAKITMRSGTMTPLDNSPTTFSIGEKGWHRLGMRYSQNVRVDNGALVYEFIFTFYVDGKVVGIYSANADNFMTKGYNLYNATLENGEIVYGTTNPVYFQFYNANFYNANNSSHFFYIKDAITSCGEDFVREVRPISYEMYDGVFVEDVRLDVVPSSVAPDHYMVSGIVHYYDVNEFATLPAPTLAGHRFQGWYSLSEGGKQVEIISPVTPLPECLYARYERNANYVAFETNGGTLTETEVWIPFGTNGFVLPEPGKIMFRLVGWYFDSAFEVSATDVCRIADGVLYIDGDLGEEGIVLYAKYEEHRPSGSVKTEYHLPLSDAVLSDGATQLLLKEQIGETVTLPTVTAPKGYVFAGWFTNADCTGEALTSFVFTEEMSEEGNDLVFYASFVPDALQSAATTDPANQPNMFYAIAQTKGDASVNYALRPYICYEFDFTAGVATNGMNFRLRVGGTSNVIQFFSLSKNGEITLNASTFGESKKISDVLNGEHRIAIVLVQGDAYIDNGDGTYGVRYYYDMTVYIDGVSVGTYRTADTLALVTSNCSYLLYEAKYTSPSECTRTTVVHTADHLRACVQSNSGKKMSVSSFINDCYLFNTDKPVYSTLVEETAE